MSVSLLRQATSKRSACSVPFIISYHRFYAAQAALAQKLVEYRDSLEHQDDAGGPRAPASKSRANKFKEGGGRNLQAPTKSKKSKIRKSDEDLAPPKDPWLPTGVELYLTGIRESGPDPTLQDIERYRPESYAPDVDSPQYTDDYNTLVDRLCRSFSRQQLREFTILYQLDSRTTLTKTDYAESIIEKQWNWPSLKEAQKRLRDRTEVSVKTFFVNPVQLFLLLGSDGTEMLQMSKDYNVHIAVERSPLALRVEGLRASLKAMSKHIDVVKKAIVEETLQLPGGKSIKQDLIQPISRLADAYVDNLGGKGTVRICAKHERNLALAKRLVTRASLESQESSRTPLLSYLPAGVSNSTSIPRVLFPQTYSVYPFLSPRSLPWTMKSGGAFRVRRVVEWLGVDDHENVQITGGLAGGKGRILDMNEKELDLKDILLANLPELRFDVATTRVVTASFGHMLLPSATTSQRASIVPPFKGFWPFTKILKWIGKSGTEATFVPSLPTQLLNSVPKQQKLIVRLEYRVLSDLSKPLDVQRHSTHAQPTKIIKFEVVIAQSRATVDVPATEHSEEVESLPVDNDITTGVDLSDSTNPRCWAGVETALNLILPDRPMDIRFIALDSIPLLRSQEPEELNAYASALQAYLQGDDRPDAPSPPSIFNYNGETYILHKSCSVRQGTEAFPDVSLDNNNKIPRASTQVVSESILDMESQQKSAICEISCHDHTSEDNWKTFLGCCDCLSAVCYDSMGSGGPKEIGPGSDLDID